MATIPRPYTKQVQLYNPQRSAASGQRQSLLEELSPAMRYKAGATPVSEMLYSSPSPVEQPPMVDYFGGGPGNMDSGDMASALAPHAPNMGFNPTSAIAGLVLGGPASVAKGIMGDAVVQAGKAIDANFLGGQVSGAITKGAHDVASALGFPSAFGMSQGAFGSSGASTDLGYIGQEAIAPPSELGSIGMGGFGAPAGAPSGANAGEAAGLGIW